MKKRIIIAISILSIFIFLINFINNKKKSIFLSDYILYPIGDNYLNHNICFSNNNLTSNLLLEYLDYNAKDIKENININNLIKQSKKIFISVGMNDLLNYVSLIDNTLIYNPTIIYQKVALLEYNINEIFNSILAIKEVDIYYLSLYYLDDFNFDEIIREYNEEVEELTQAFGVNYIEINNLIKIDNYEYNLTYQKKIYEYLESIS